MIQKIPSSLLEVVYMCTVYRLFHCSVVFPLPSLEALSLVVETALLGSH